MFCRSLLVSDAHKGEARGQSWPRALSQVLRCRGSGVARGFSSAPVGATVDVHLRVGHSSSFASALGNGRLR